MYLSISSFQWPFHRKLSRRFGHPLEKWRRDHGSQSLGSEDHKSPIFRGWALGIKEWHFPVAPERVCKVYRLHQARMYATRTVEQQEDLLFDRMGSHGIRYTQYNEMPISLCLLANSLNDSVVLNIFNFVSVLQWKMLQNLDFGAYKFLK